MSRLVRSVVAALAVAGITVTASCGSTAESGQGETVLTVAAVDNGDLDRLRDLSVQFTTAHPGTRIEWVRQSENDIRETISTDVATQGGRFDVVTIGPFETQIWGERKVLTPLTQMPQGFDAQEFIPAVRDAMSSEGQLLAAPFYGEAAFTMYRKDIFDKAGLTMPEQPTWQFVLDAAQRIHGSGETAGVCVRGRPGWGENMAFVTAMAHSYGAQWFDDAWTPQLNSPQWQRTTQDYIALTRSAPEGVADAGFQTNLQLFQQGKCAMWIDATSAASFVTDPKASTVADQVAFAMAPTSADAGTPMNWLWAWGLAVPENSDAKELAGQFVAWATSADYQKLAASRYGLTNVPPGARADLYSDAAYLQAAPYAPLVEASIERQKTSGQTGTAAARESAQYVAVPAFQSIGNAVGQQLTQVIRGELSEQQALENSQWVADRVIAQTRALAQQTSGN